MVDMTATEKMEHDKLQLVLSRKNAYEKLYAAEKAWYEYFCLCEVGEERTRAHDIYQNVRCATRRF